MSEDIASAPPEGKTEHPIFYVVAGRQLGLHESFVDDAVVCACTTDGEPCFLCCISYTVVHFHQLHKIPDRGHHAIGVEQNPRGGVEHAMS